MRCVALGLLLGGLPQVAWGGAAPSLPDLEGLGFRPATREEVLQRWVEHSPELARARFDVADRQSVYRGVDGLYDSFAGASAIYARSEDPENGDVTQVPLLAVSMAQRLPIGTTLSLTLGNSLTESRTPVSTNVPNSPTIDDVGETPSGFGPSLSATLAQPLLRGFGLTANRAPRAVAGGAATVETKRLQQSASSSALRVLSTYAGLAYAAERHEVHRRAWARLEAQLQAVEAQIEAGRRSPLEGDVLAARTAEARDAALAARASIRRRARELGDALGSDSAPLLAAETLRAPRPLDSDEELCRDADAASPELAVLAAEVELARSQLVRTADERLPFLDLTAGAIFRGLGDEFGEAYGDLFELDSKTVYAGFVLQVPLTAKAPVEAHRRAERALRRARLELETRRLRLCAEVRERRAQLAILAERRTIGEQRRSVARRALDAEAERFELGRSTPMDTVDAIDRFEGAELALLLIRRDEEQQWLELEHLSGALLASLPPLEVPER